MASRSMSAMLVLAVVVVAAFCVAESNATEPKLEVHGPLKLKIKLKNECGYNVKLELKAGKPLDCKKGKQVEFFHPGYKFEVLYKLKLKLTVYDGHGKPLKIKADIIVDAHKLGKIVKGVLELVFDLKEEYFLGKKFLHLITADKKYSIVKLYIK